MADVFVSWETTMSVFPGGYVRRFGHLQSNVNITDSFALEESGRNIATAVGVSDSFEIETGFITKSQEDDVTITDEFDIAVEKPAHSSARVGSTFAMHVDRNIDQLDEVGIQDSFKKIVLVEWSTDVGASVDPEGIPTKPVKSLVRVGSDFICNRNMQLSWETEVGVTSGILTRAPRRPCDLSALGKANARLTFPYVSPVITIDLKAPRFGNIDTVDTGELVQRNLAGVVESIRPSTWNNTLIKAFAFEVLNVNKVDDIMDFLIASQGLEVGYRDHENVQWRGFMIAPEVTITRDVEPCSYGLSFRFRGVRA